MFFHLLTHVVTHQVLRDSGRVPAADGYYRDADLTRRARESSRALAWLVCGGLLLGWVVMWGAAGRSLPWKAALCSEIGFVLAALNLVWITRQSRWLERLGAISCLLQLAAGIAFAAFSGLNMLHDDLARFSRVCLVVLPPLELAAVDLYLYHRWRLKQFQGLPFFEEPAQE